MKGDTIAAISTPPGEGGIAIVRISGEESGKILKKIFKPANPDIDMLKSERKFTFGYVIEPEEDAKGQTGGAGIEAEAAAQGEVIDEAMAVFMRAPRTYTCADAAEIQVHGGRISARRVLECALKCGARAAEPGEFTKLAFLNGRIDLAQAEAVIDLISAKTDSSFGIAENQLAGRLSSEINACLDQLTDLLSHIAVNIDYSEEDIEEITRQEVSAGLSKVSEELRALLDTYNTGKILKDGLEIAIVGRPNAGKSSVLNRLLREDRSIVTQIPGTTRDTVEEWMDLGGIPIHLTDTAGIHETEDEIEKIGIDRSKQAQRRADLILFVIDSSLPIDDEDCKIAAEIGDKPCLVLMNKCDISRGQEGKDSDQGLGVRGQKGIKDKEEARPVRGELSAKLTERGLNISAKTGEGFAELEQTILDLVNEDQITIKNSAVLANERQRGLINEAASELNDAISECEAGTPIDLIETGIRAAFEALGQVVGRSCSEEVINEIFNRFCVGK